MKKIKVILPVNCPDEWLDDTAGSLNAVKDADTELSVGKIPWGPPVIEQHYDDIWAELPTLLEAEKAEREGYDGVLIQCAGDPAVRAIREKLSIPTVGLMEAAVHLAYILGRRFSIITTLEAGVAATEDLLRLYDCTTRCVSIRVLGLTVQELMDKEKTFDATLREADISVKQDRADVLIMGCALMTGLQDVIMERLGVPVIEPHIAALKATEDLIAMRLSHSRLAYRAPQNNNRTLPGGIGA